MSSSNGTIFRIEKTKDFTVMCNHHLKNTNLSLKAKGLLSLMLSLPENWDYSVMGLVAICKDGESSVRGGIKELETQGYITRKQERSKNGRVGRVNFIVREIPILISDVNKGFSPHGEKPHAEKPHAGKPHADNQAQSSTKELSIKESSIKESSTHLSFNHMISTEALLTDGLMDYEKVISFLDDKLNFSEADHSQLSFNENEYFAYRDMIAEIFCKNDNDYIRINSKDLEAVKVKIKFMLIDLNTINYVHEQMSAVKTKIKNVFNYTITALYRAPINTKAGNGLKFTGHKSHASYDIEAFTKMLETQSIWD